MKFGYYRSDNSEARTAALAAIAEVAAARQSLETQEREALLRCWRAHVSIDDVAAALGVSRATAHRRLAAAVDYDSGHRDDENGDGERGG